MTKNIWGYVIVGVICLAFGYLLHTGGGRLGASTGLPSINLTPTTAGGDTYALAVNGTSTVDLYNNISGQAITATTSIAINGGTPLVKAQCGTKSFNTGALASFATTTFDVAVTGATTSVNQVYWVGNATGSQASTNLFLKAGPTSTTGFVNVFGYMASSSLTYSVSNATTVFSVCYIQF